jgi:hypothetical protein
MNKYGVPDAEAEAAALRSSLQQISGCRDE